MSPGSWLRLFAFTNGGRGGGGDDSKGAVSVIFFKGYV